MPTAKSAVAELACFRLWRSCRRHRRDVDHALVVVFWDARYIDHARRCVTLTNLCAQFPISALGARRAPIVS